MTGPFSRKISGFSCDLTALQKIKQLRAKAVETRLGVTGLLGKDEVLKNDRKKLGMDSTDPQNCSE